MLWALGRRLWAPGHLVVGRQAVVRGRRLSLWVLGVRGRWVVVRGWNVRGRVVRALGCDLWGRWCRVVCRVLMVSEIGWDEWGQGTHYYS